MGIRKIILALCLTVANQAGWAADPVFSKITIRSGDIDVAAETLSLNQENRHETRAGKGKSVATKVYESG